MSTGRSSSSFVTTSSARARPPTIGRVSTAGGFDTKRLFTLFPKKPARKMAYLAGLPKPHGCV